MLADSILPSFYAFETKVLGNGLEIWLLVFSRVLAFANTAPVLSRKDVPFEARLGLSLFIATVLFWVIPIPKGPVGLMSGMQAGVYTLLIVLNVWVGIVLGFMVRMVMETIISAGALVTSQVGLQAANIFDPTTKQQNALLGPLFGFIAALIYVEMGGMEWLLQGLERSFTLFPLTQTVLDMPAKISIDTLIKLSGDSLDMGLLLAAPFFVVTMTVDILLGIVNRAAQQIPVFQLSFGLKPAIGVALFILAIPTLVEAISNYLKDTSHLF